MASVIKKIRLKNFKRFTDYTITPNEHINILVGDNEVGKSSILEAIDLVASGSVRRVEVIGLDRLLNIEAVNSFMVGEKSFENLPELRIELYLNLDRSDPLMNGANNSDKKVCDGIRLVCKPNSDYRAEINEILRDNPTYFPYDYYTVRFSTFADNAYSSYKKKLRTTLIDSTSMNSIRANDDFIDRMYRQYTDGHDKERAEHRSQYRLMRTKFQSESLKTLNERIPENNPYSFGLKNGSSMSLEGDLMLYENDIGIDSKGTGRQVFVKTDFALQRSGDNVDAILIEEPENHLSPVNLRKLVGRIARTSNGQLFITTHSSLISTRLELRNLLIMHRNDNAPVMLKDLSEDTAKYFMKAPSAGVIEFTLAKKLVLVEGPSEYMLFERFYKGLTNNTPEEDNIHIIDVGGLTFKRYLEIAQLAGIKVAVITDNDKDYQRNVVEKYVDFVNEDIQVFAHNNNNERTFEIVLYAYNSALCDRLFGEKPVEWMLKNKTEAAYKLLNQDVEIVVPDYIKEAIAWIRE